MSPRVPNLLGMPHLGFEWDDARQSGITVHATNVDLGIRTVLLRYRSSIPEFVWDAADLEGSATDFLSIQTLVGGEQRGNLPDDDVLMICNLIDAHRALDQMIRDRTFAMTKAVSDELHRHLATGVALEAGHFRGEGSTRATPSVQLADGGEYLPPPTEPGGQNLVDIFDRGVDYLTGSVPRPMSRALAYFAFAARHQFYFDANKRTARMMMNGILMSNRIDAITVPGRRAVEWEDGLHQLYRDAEPSALFAVLTDCQPEIRYVRSRRTQEPDWGDERDWIEVADRAYEARLRLSAKPTDGIK